MIDMISWDINDDKQNIEELLKKIHETQLEIAVEVKRICIKNNINYSLIAGSLLGAVRHTGFIPWDDDLDIGMLREDYNKFIVACKTDLNNKYFLQTWDTDSDFPLPIAKIRKKGTRYIERNSSKSNHHHGIFIDIFPFDNIPNNNRKKRIQDLKTYVLKRVLIVKNNYIIFNENEKFKIIIYYIFKTFTIFLSKDKIKKELYRIMTMYNFQQTDEITTFGGAYGYKKESIKIAWFNDLREIYFEGEEWLSLANPENYLTHFYGDFRTPVPEHKRYNRHNIIDINFEEE